MQSTILVGDIGSTKSSWWYQGDGAQEIRLPGYNPVTQSASKGRHLAEALQQSIKPTLVSAIWYYGAGVLDKHFKARIKEIMADYFPGCPVHVYSDLTGAAIAACGASPGTVAILGTGSHAAQWDGREIIRQAPALGYMLGDEGSGCDIGKALLQAYFYHEMPDELCAEMKQRLPNGRTDLFANLSHSDAPNEYLADFTRIATTHKASQWVQALVADRFRLFIQRLLLPLNPEKEIHIIGSIGFIFADIIREELEKAGLTLGKRIQDPARPLFDAHIVHGQTQ